MAKLRLITSAVLFSLSASAFAGGAAGGGSTEVTQIMNNGELMASVSKQSQMVAGQIRDYTAQMNQYTTMLQNLKTLPQEVIAEKLGPLKEQLKDLSELYQATNEVYVTSTDAFNTLQRRRAEMQALNLSPSEYLNSEMLLAKMKGGNYKKQADHDLWSLKNAEQKSTKLASMDKQIASVGGNVEGLQLLAQFNQMMAGELMELNSQLREKSLQENQSKIQEQALIEENKKRQAAMRIKAEAEAEATAKAISSGKYDVEANRQKLFKGM